MKPCSAYCRPEANRHTFFDFVVEGADPVGLVARVTARARNYCLPEGTDYLVVQAERAVEVPPTWDERFPVAMLLTVEVLS